MILSSLLQRLSLVIRLEVLESAGVLGDLCDSYMSLRKYYIEKCWNSLLVQGVLFSQKQGEQILAHKYRHRREHRRGYDGADSRTFQGCVWTLACHF